MVAPDLTKLILHAVADALPGEGGHNLLTRLEIQKGWGDAINIELYSTIDPADPTRRTIEQHIKAAIDAALDQERHNVRFHWQYSTA